MQHQDPYDPDNNYEQFMLKVIVYPLMAGCALIAVVMHIILK